MTGMMHQCDEGVSCLSKQHTPRCKTWHCLASCWQQPTSLRHCELQIGKYDEAAKQLDAALAQAPATAAELRQTLVNLKAHFAAVAGKASKADGKDSAASAIPSAAQSVLSSKMMGDAARAIIAEAAKRAESAVAAGAATEVAKLAWAACIAGATAQAEALCAALGSSTSDRARAWVQLVRSQQHMAQDSDVASLSVASVAARRQALEAFEMCIRDFQKHKDVEGLQAACRCGHCLAASS